MKTLSDYINETFITEDTTLTDIEKFLNDYCTYFKFDRNQWWYQKGRKYFKILKRQGANGKYMDDKYSITEMFIDVDGYIYKPASTHKPANSIRGNIYDKNVFTTVFDNFGFVASFG